MARVGAKESFENGKLDLEELAGVRVTAKEVERVSEKGFQDIIARYKYPSGRRIHNLPPR